jgi:hypothetical protein
MVSELPDENKTTARDVAYETLQELQGQRLMDFQALPLGGGSIHAAYGRRVSWLSSPLLLRQVDQLSDR